jgi:hypothetical protein
MRWAAALATAFSVEKLSQQHFSSWIQHGASCSRNIGPAL